MDGGEKRDTRGRKIADAARHAEVVAAYAASGLTQKAFARQEDVNYHTLVAWLGREQRSAPAATTGKIGFRQLQLGRARTARNWKWRCRVASWCAAATRRRWRRW